MHSFFQPKAKKQKIDEAKQQPASTIVTWNVTGMLSVVADKSNRPAQDLKAFVERQTRTLTAQC